MARLRRALSATGRLSSLRYRSGAMLRTTGFLLCLKLLLVSCSSDGGGGDTPAPNVDDGARITCENDPRDVYVANLQKAGRSGGLDFVLAESSPAPPSRGRNTWTIKVLDTSGNAVAGAKITLTASMPAHGHSSPTVPVVTPMGDAYSIGPVSLFMPGLWEVTVEAEAGGVRDQTTFSFCVAG